MFEKVGTVGFQFLEIGAGARGTAMGEAMVAATMGIESLYWNPAGLRHVTSPTVFFSHGTWPADITHQFVGYATRPGFIRGVVGVSITSLSMEPMQVRTADSRDGVGIEFDCGDIAIGLSYTRVFTDKFAAGGTLRWYHSGLGDLSPMSVDGLGDYFAEGFVGDFGTLYNTGFRSLKIGLCIQNMGPGSVYYLEDVPTPSTFKFGISMNVIEAAGQRLLVAAEFRHPADTSEKVNVGAEYALRDIYFLRAGYKMNYDEETFTTGGGVIANVGALGKVGLDYSYCAFGHLGIIHRISMQVEF